jgi:hypothetical protein
VAVGLETTLVAAAVAWKEGWWEEEVDWVVATASACHSYLTRLMHQLTYMPTLHTLVRRLTAWSAPQGTLVAW